MQEVKIGEELMYDRNDDLKAIIDEVDSAVGRCLICRHNNGNNGARGAPGIIRE